MKYQHLYDRLKPETKKILEQEAAIYPYTYKEMLEELRNKRFILDLSYNTVRLFAGISALHPIMETPNFTEAFLFQNWIKLFEEN